MAHRILAAADLGRQKPPPDGGNSVAAPTQSPMSRYFAARLFSAPEGLPTPATACPLFFASFRARGRAWVSLIMVVSVRVELRFPDRFGLLTASFSLWGKGKGCQPPAPGCFADSEGVFPESGPTAGRGSVGREGALRR